METKERRKKVFEKSAKTRKKIKRRTIKDWDTTKENVQEANEVFFYAPLHSTQENCHRETNILDTGLVFPYIYQWEIRNEGMAFYISLFPQNWPAWLKLM